MKIVQSKILKITDFLIVLSFILNLFAIGMTNYMVVKKQPDIKFMESNPIQTNIINNDFVLDKEWKSSLNKLFKQGFIWFFIFLGYYYLRREFTFKTGLDCIVYTVLFSFIFISIDFANNLGFFLGKIYGG